MLDITYIKSLFDVEPIYIQFAIPLAVITCLGLVFVFGFRKTVNPPSFQLLTSNDYKRKRVNDAKKSNKVKQTVPPLINTNSSTTNKTKAEKNIEKCNDTLKKIKNASKKNEIVKKANRILLHNDFQSTEVEGEWQTCLSKKRTKRLKDDSISSEKENISEENISIKNKKRNGKKVFQNESKKIEAANTESLKNPEKKKEEFGTNDYKKNEINKKTIPMPKIDVNQAGKKNNNKKTVVGQRIIENNIKKNIVIKDNPVEKNETANKEVNDKNDINVLVLEKKNFKKEIQTNVVNEIGQKTDIATVTDSEADWKLASTKKPKRKARREH